MLCSTQLILTMYKNNFFLNQIFVRRALEKLGSNPTNLQVEDERLHEAPLFMLLQVQRKYCISTLLKNNLEYQILK